MTEKQVEEYLREKVKEIGGRAYKWTSPGNSGVPDRIVVIPGGRIYFIELKKPKGGRTSSLQKVQQKRLKGLGAKVLELHTRELIDEFIRKVRGNEL